MMKFKTPVCINISVFACFLLLSLICQLVFGQINLEVLKFPMNLMLLVELIAIIVGLHIFFRKSKVVRWLSSPSAAIISIAYFSVWVTLMATIPQNSEINISLSLNNILNTWMFASSVLFVLISLGLVTFRRIFPLNRKNVLFFVNHFGLWLALSAGVLGAADKMELTMKVYENQIVWLAQDSDDKTIELPLAIRLKDFVMKTHPPKIAIIDSTGKPYKAKGDQLTEVVSKNEKKIDQYTITPIEIIIEAKWNGQKFVNAPGMEAIAPAIYVKVTDNDNHHSEKGWISSGSYAQYPVAYPLSPNKFLALLPPEPAYFGSKITLFSKSDSSATETIVSVNNPISTEGWTIYQYSYDHLRGNDSPYSVFMLVKDPWLPVVYVGFFLMMIGALFLMFTNINTKKREKLL